MGDTKLPNFATDFKPAKAPPVEAERFPMRADKGCEFPPAAHSEDVDLAELAAPRGRGKRATPTSAAPVAGGAKKTCRLRPVATMPSVAGEAMSFSGSAIVATMSAPPPAAEGSAPASASEAAPDPVSEAALASTFEVSLAPAPEASPAPGPEAATTNVVPPVEPTTLHRAGAVSRLVGGLLFGRASAAIPPSGSTVGADSSTYRVEEPMEVPLPVAPVQPEVGPSVAPVSDDDLQVTGWTPERAVPPLDALLAQLSEVALLAVGQARQLVGALEQGLGQARALGASIEGFC